MGKPFYCYKQNIKFHRVGKTYLKAHLTAEANLSIISRSRFPFLSRRASSICSRIFTKKVWEIHEITFIKTLCGQDIMANIHLSHPSPHLIRNSRRRKRHGSWKTLPINESVIRLGTSMQLIGCLETTLCPKEQFIVMKIWLKHEALKAHEEKTASTGFGVSPRWGWLCPFHIPNASAHFSSLASRAADEERIDWTQNSAFRMGSSGWLEASATFHNFSLNH